MNKRYGIICALLLIVLLCGIFAEALAVMMCPDCGLEMRLTERKKATSKSDGLEVYLCLSCNKQVKIVLHGPSRKSSPEHATCDKAGRTEGEYCSNCDALLVNPQTIPAKGHSYSDKVKSNNNGKHYFICDRCGYQSTSKNCKYKYVFQGNGQHNAICTVCGYMITEACEYQTDDSTGTCLRCGQSKFAKPTNSIKKLNGAKLKMLNNSSASMDFLLNMTISGSGTGDDPFVVSLEGEALEGGVAQQVNGYGEMSFSIDEAFSGVLQSGNVINFNIESPTGEQGGGNYQGGVIDADILTISRPGSSNNNSTITNTTDSNLVIQTDEQTGQATHALQINSADANLAVTGIGINGSNLVLQFDANNIDIIKIGMTLISLPQE